MKLDKFITNTLKEITEGVAAAQLEGVTIESRTTTLEHADGCVHETTRDNAFNVCFDLDVCGFENDVVTCISQAKSIISNNIKFEITVNVPQKTQLSKSLDN